MIGTKGDFQINPRWSFGWDLLYQSDKNFSRTYGIEGYSDVVQRSEIYLTGLNDRNLFDLHAYHFNVQEALPDSSRFSRDPVQPWVLPSFDYTYTPDEPVAGGELNIDVNAQGIYRSELDCTTSVGPARCTAPTSVPGPEGTSGRITAQAEWKRTFITRGGLVITPSLQARGDAIFTDFTPATQTAIASLGVATDIRSAYYRYMATAGLEARWPILFSTASSTNVIEPVIQVFASPDEQFANTLGIPNEDAQSLVFDATNLFESDRFSGYDRMEGGVRANVGFRYSGTFANGWTADAIFGQSFHLAGVNSFASPDLVNVGAESGLETAASDYVGQVGLSFGQFRMTAGARLDNADFQLRRVDVGAAQSFGPVDVSARYAYIQAQPKYGYPTDRHAVSAGVTARVRENWRVFATGTYDLITPKLTSDSFGFAYDDECFTYSMTFRETHPIKGKSSQSIGFFVSLRTLGDFGSSTSNVLPQ